jgi:DnaK suppressor protein
MISPPWREFSQGKVGARGQGFLERGYVMAIDLPKMRILLLEKRGELLRNAAGLTEVRPGSVGSEEVSESPQDLGDAAIDVVEMQREQAILVNDQTLLQEVDDALARIENGTYGRCIVCGQPIPQKRLEAIPWAARCIKDEEEFERKRGELDRQGPSSSP